VSGYPDDSRDREESHEQRGTGRFAGASGHLTVDGLANMATGTYSQSLAGSLTGH
jgi:hypothetical protein